MAQWIPKTAWKHLNLNKLYGVGELGLHTTQSGVRQGVRQQTPFLATTFRPVPVVASDDKNNNNLKEARKMLKQAYDAKVPFIDLRDSFEAEEKPLKKALQLHHHDLLSGAANDILPQDRRNAQIVVFASSQQRVLNGYRALRRWGFETVLVTNYDVVCDFDNNNTLEQK
jgi:hypothetical protein